MFLYSFSGALSPCAVWNKTKTQLVVLSLLVWQWGCCESGDFKRILCCNIQLGVGTNFWRFVNLVLEEAYHRKCFVPYNSFSWLWFIGPWYYKSCFLIPSSLSEISDSFCRAKLAPFCFYFFIFVLLFSLKTLFSSIPIVYMSFFLLILSLSGNVHLKNISVKVISHLRNARSKKFKIFASLRKCIDFST